MTYLGYHAAISYDKQDRIFVGTVLGIADSISFHAETKSGLQAAFHRAINSYLEMCWGFHRGSIEWVGDRTHLLFCLIWYRFVNVYFNG